LAFPSSALLRALFNLFVLAFNLCVLLGQLVCLERELFVGLLQFLLFGFAIRRPIVANCCRRLSVCIVASMLLSTIPMLAVSCSRRARCEAVNRCPASQLNHRFDSILEKHRATP